MFGRPPTDSPTRAFSPRIYFALPISRCSSSPVQSSVTMSKSSDPRRRLAQKRAPSSRRDQRVRLSLGSITVLVENENVFYSCARLRDPPPTHSTTGSACRTRSETRKAKDLCSKRIYSVRFLHLKSVTSMTNVCSFFPFLYMSPLYTYTHTHVFNKFY